MVQTLRFTAPLVFALALFGCSSSNGGSDGTGGSPGSFTLAVSTSSLAFTQGNVGTDTVSVVDAGSFDGTVALAVTGLPAGVTAYFQPASTSRSSLLTLTAGASATPGNATVSVTGTSGLLTATTTIALLINEAGGIIVVPSALSVAVAQGGQNDDIIDVGTISPFAGSVTLTASGLPSGVTATFATNPAATVSGVTFVASASAATGTSNVTINGSSGTLSASTTIALTVNPPETILTGPFQWTTSAPVVSAMPPMVAVKDPSTVFYNGEYHIYASSVDASGDYGMEYLHFANWSDAGTAEPYYLSSTPGFAGYHTAPQVFYFTPQKMWYLIFQSGQPQFSTNSDLTKPQNWTAPQNLLDEPSGASWLDYWIICDTANCYLFFTGDNGNFYRSSTSIANFPFGFGAPVTVMSEANPADLFEADNVYKVANANLYLALIECGGPGFTRYFRAFTATTLDGDWTPLNGADSFTTPFLGKNNVAFASGVTPWTTDFSSGGLIPGYDETDQIDPTKLQFVFQGDNTATFPAGTSYGMIPWQLGLATQ